jgi:two-component system phosphate regulon sensor histidine kinase PhoR
MWPILAALLGCGLVMLHLAWRRHSLALQRELARQREEFAALQQQSQQAIGHELARQDALIHSMIEGVLVLDRHGQVSLVNRSMQKSFGLESDIRGRTIMEAFRQHELQELVQRTAVEGQVLGFEMDLPGRFARRFQINATAIRDQNGQPQGMVLVFHDVTRLKQLENTRQEFVANVSHELRTPLSILKGYVETLLDGAKNDPEVATRFLQTIKKHTDRLTYLIEDLLTISLLESGRVALNLQLVDLRPMVDRVVEDLSSRALERKTRLENQVPSDLIANADTDRIQQVLFNLVDNAIKYGRPAGQVSVSGRLIAPGRIELSVKDDGPGIPPEAQERVFERFYRVDRARSREQGGTGLGLSIVKHIVQSHGGKVWLESEMGKGTTFFLTLRQALPETK